MADANPTTITPERILLSAILRTMKPAKRNLILAIVGDTHADNIIKMRAPHAGPERNRLIRECHDIAALANGAR